MSDPRRLAKKSLELFAADGPFEIAFGSQEECEGVAAALEDMGCRVTIIPTSKHLQVIPPPFDQEPSQNWREV